MGGDGCKAFAASCSLMAPVAAEEIVYLARNMRALPSAP
jgi:hypothetical protein